MNPGALPEPPADLAGRTLSILDFGKSIFRSHNVFRHPVFFGNAGLYRFDAPDGSYKVLYAGLDLHCAFIESLIKNANSRVVTTTELKSKAVAELKAVRALRLIDLTPSGALMRMGADSRLFSGDHGAARIWSKSKALHDHPIRAAGILYPSRLDPVRQAVALFEDRAPKLVELSLQVWYAPGPLRHSLAQIAEHYKIELIENRFVTPRKPIAAAPGLLDLKPLICSEALSARILYSCRNVTAGSTSRDHRAGT